ncbi:S41 family peptidase [Vibrio atypicus]|uniref:S41 family peptidase n=1 Tax=Vibrio atypicus TaxID=558271 RepID=UPI0013589D72|nr:S41 family peptidase [Vibrio atypicus]
MLLTRCRRGALALSLLIALPNAAVSAPTQADESERSPKWMRDVVISPDGQKIAFTYSGQIWLVNSTGGEATPLTSNDVYSDHPIWSPDGKSIAFQSKRFGAGDVFIVPSVGGQAKRLTFHSSADVPYAFSSDGSEVLFSSRRLGDSEATLNNGFMGNGSKHLYSVSSEGGRERLLLSNPVSALSVKPDGSAYLYTDEPSFEQEWRKRAISDATRDIWRYDSQTQKHQKLTSFRGEDRNAVWSQDGSSFYYLSERSGSFNVWKKSFIEGAKPEQVTQHDTLPVRFLSTSLSGDLAYGYNGEIWLKKSNQDASKPVNVFIRQTSLNTGRRFVTLNHEATEIAVSPYAPEVAIVARGDVYVVSLLSGATKRITDTPAAERDISFSKDGYVIRYASERNGNWDIFQSYVNDTGKSFSTSFDIKEEQLSDEPADEFQPLYSPNGKKVIYREDRNTLKVYDLEQDQTYTLLDSQALYSYMDGDLTYSWSPDSEYVVTRNNSELDSDVILLKSDGSQAPIQVTNTGFTENRPKFSHDGQAVYWLSNAKSSYGIDGFANQQDIYITYLNQQAQFDANKSDEQKWLDEEIAGGRESDDDQSPPNPTLVEEKGFKHRTERVTSSSLWPLFFHLSSDNRYMVIISSDGDNAEISEIDLTTGEQTHLFTRSYFDVRAAVMSSDDETLIIIGDQGIEKLNVVTNDSEYIDYAAQANYDFSGEVRYMFDHVWQLTKSKFYDPNMHGVNWEQYGELYREQLSGIHNYIDFAELLSELAGELNASHTGSDFDDYVNTWEEPSSLGLYYDDQYRGKGVRVKSVLAGGPADTYGSPIKKGAIIYSVDGVDVSPGQDIYPLLNFKKGRMTKLSVLKPGEESAQDFKIVPISLRQEGVLAYDEWVEQRQALTEKLSNGRLGYVHLAEMGPDSFERMQNDLFGKYRDKEAVVVDVRFNGGGNLTSQLMEILSGVRHSSIETRDGYTLTSFPERRWAKPSIMIADANSYSDGSITPFFYKREGLGQLVGERVPGTGTAVIWPSLQEPRINYGVPQLGFKDDEGNWFENQEIEPDILVYKSPEDVAKNRDRQLEVAVEALLKQLDEK